MTVAKVQHYVPRFLLRNFAAAGKREQLHVFDKKDGKAFCANVKNVAAESRFYDFEIEGRLLTVEPGLAELEAVASRVIDKLLEADTLTALSREDRAGLAVFFAIQHMRTRTFREMFRQIPLRLRERMQRDGHTEKDLEAIQEHLRVPDENELAMESARFMAKSAGDFVPLYLNKDWILIAADEPGAPLQINDNPVVFQNSIAPKGPYGNLGLAVKGIEIYCPLSPTRGMAMWCRSLLGDIRSATTAVLLPKHRTPMDEQTRELLAAADSGQPLRYKSENAMNFNSLQIAYAERYVFSHDGNFELARDMLRKEPGLRQGPRMQIA